MDGRWPPAGAIDGEESRNWILLLVDESRQFIYGEDKEKRSSGGGWVE